MHRAERLAFGIARVGRDAQTDASLVLLVAAAEKSCKARRASEDDGKNATRGGIERAGVSRASLAERAPDARDHVVGGGPGRLVND
jgi:hypothetical protein